MKPLLIAAIVVGLQVFILGGYQVVSIITRSWRSAIILLAWLAGSVLVALFAFGLVKSDCHECLTAPSVAVCPHSNHAFDWELQSNRVGGFMQERHFAGCYFYWHENTTGGN